MDKKYSPTKPYVTYLLIGLCVAISLPTLIVPEVIQLFSGIGQQQYFWQPFTAVFMHGFPGLPMSIHLAANMLLLLFCGSIVENLLRRKRFAFLTLSAILVAGITRLISNIEFNGSSAFIWAYSPIMLIALYQGQLDDDMRGQVIVVLWIMWAVVGVMMGLFVLAGDYSGPVLLAFVWGNIYHLTAVLTGTILGVWWFESKAASA